MEKSDTSPIELEVSEAHQPASVADDKKTEVPASGAEDQNSEAVETPEQLEAKKESRRARSNARKAAALAEARTEARLLRERLEKLEAQPKQQTQEVTEPKREDFPDYEAYLRAVTKYDAKQEATSALKADREAQQGKVKQEQAAVSSEKVAKAWTERETSFQTATKDYQEVVAPFVDDELQHLSHQARMAIVESDVGPALLYHLAKHPEEADRIADLSPLRQVAELGKLEAKAPMPAKKTTSAPAPANTTTGGRTASKDLSKMNQEEYEAHRKASGARWAR